MGVRFMSDHGRHKNSEGDMDTGGVHQYRKLLQEKIKSVPSKKTSADYSRTPPPPRALFFSGTLGKYSHELFNSSVKSNDFENVKNQLEKLLTTFNADQKLQNALYSPIIRKDEKIKASHSFTANSSEAVVKMIERLVSENKIRDLKVLVDYFNQLVAEKLGQNSCCRLFC